jgi:hypothetical protein
VRAVGVEPTLLSELDFESNQIIGKALYLL